jgi:type IV secretory pathway VirB3-like protein
MKTTRPTAKALNKPLLIAGVDMRLAGLALVIATVAGAVNDALVYKGIAAALFFAVCACARIATRRDPNLLVVWNLARRHRWLYDPAKRAAFRVVFVRSHETEQ